jgi:hypothetical protein
MEKTKKCRILYFDELNPAHQIEEANDLGDDQAREEMYILGFSNEPLRLSEFIVSMRDRPGRTVTGFMHISNTAGYKVQIEDNSETAVLTLIY